MMKNMKKRSRDRNRLPDNLILEEVIGLTTKNGNGLAASTSSSKCAYIAGCVVVLYDVDSGVQSHLVAPSRVPKPLSCVSLSRDASIVAAGESGPQPAILIWDCATLTFTCELKGHQYGVACMALSHDGKHLLSVGFPHDGYICLWDWRSKILAAKVKASSISSPISSIGFSLDEKLIVTAGKNHLKFWKVKWPPGSRAGTRSVSVTMQREIDPGHHKDWSFAAVTSPWWMIGSSVNHIQAGERIPFYAVTEKGTLCMVHPGSSIINSVSVELEVEKCFALSTSTSLVACACNNGVVKLFGTSSLNYVGELCYVEAKRCKKSDAVDCKTSSDQDELQSLPTLPDAIACQFLASEKLVVVYDDHSLYIWNIQDIHKATRCCVLASHSGCIWDINNVPCENMHDPSLLCVAKGCSGGLSFATCSADGTIRLWDLALQSFLSENGSSLTGDDSAGGASCLVGAGIFERDSVAKGISFPGFRSMAVSSDGKYLAAGDCKGNIHVFNLYSSDYICIQDAHNSEILSLSFTLVDKNDNASTGASESHKFLVSGGGDGRIHIFDVDRNFNLFGSIDFHSSAVTAVKVARSGHNILSCGADRSLVLHSVDASDTECKISFLHRIATSGIISDMAVDPQMNVAFTVGQDKKINAFDIQSGKHIKWFQHEGEVGNPIKVATDGSCSYLACSYSNRCICIYEYLTGKMVAQATGHGDAITGIIFLPDCKHLITVAADGCIFVWKLPAVLSSKMLLRTKGNSIEFLPEIKNQPWTSSQIESCPLIDNWHKGYRNEASNGNMNQTHKEMVFREGCSPENAGFKFSVSRLPTWARSKVITHSPPMHIDSTSSKVGVQQDYLFLGSQSPSKDILKVGQKKSATLSKPLSETGSSQVSPSPPETYRWALNNRWLTIHTVCMDLLDSPETCDRNGLNVPGSETDSRSRGEDMETIRSSKRIKLSCLDPCINNHSSEPNFIVSEHVNIHDAPPFEEHKCLYNSSSSNHGADKLCISDSNDSQENDICKINVGDSSAQMKTDKGKSSTRGSHLSRFLVGRVLEGGKRRCMDAQDFLGHSLRETGKSNSSFLPMKPSISLLQDIPRINSVEIPDSITCGEMPLDTEMINVKNEKVHDVDKVEELEIVRSCEEALHHLEAAAENALKSFGKLASVNIEEKSNYGVPLYDKAAARLSSIEGKIQAVAKLLQSENNFERENSGEFLS